jgi:hypothetical protein
MPASSTSVKESVVNPRNDSNGASSKKHLRPVLH